MANIKPHLFSHRFRVRFEDPRFSVLTKQATEVTTDHLNDILSVTFTATEDTEFHKAILVLSKTKRLALHVDSLDGHGNVSLSEAYWARPISLLTVRSYLRSGVLETVGQFACCPA